MRILAIAGSLRSTSSNAALLRAGVAVVFYEGLGTIPPFSPDLDVEPLPGPVAALRAQIAAADAIIICSPEYAHGMPGVLKNLLDWLVSALEALGKPVLLVSASPGGAAHAHAQLSEVLRTMNLKLVDGGAHVFTRARLDAQGGVSDPALLAAVARGVAALVNSVDTTSPPGGGERAPGEGSRPAGPPSRTPSGPSG
jgi:NAD(P)H-dependent FMN reductase